MSNPQPEDKANPLRRAVIWLSCIGIVAGVITLALYGAPQQENRQVRVPIQQVAKKPEPPSGLRNGRLYLSQQDKRSVTLANGEQRVVASLLDIIGPMRYGKFVWNESGVAEGPVWIRVDLDGQTLSVFRGEHEIGAGVVLFGADSHPTPTGMFPVLAKFKDHESSIYDAKMPYTMRLTGDGVAIHGSNVRRGLATHGCIGIPTEFAAHIFAVINVKDPVYIVRAKAT